GLGKPDAQPVAVFALQGLLDGNRGRTPAALVGLLFAVELHELPDDDDLGIGDGTLDALGAAEQRLGGGLSRDPQGNPDGGERLQTGEGQFPPPRKRSPPGSPKKPSKAGGARKPER